MLAAATRREHLACSRSSALIFAYRVIGLQQRDALNGSPGSIGRITTNSDFSDAAGTAIDAG